MSVRGRSISGIRALSAVCFTGLSLTAFQHYHRHNAARLMSRKQSHNFCEPHLDLSDSGELKAWRSAQRPHIEWLQLTWRNGRLAVASGSSTSSLTRSLWELACSNGGLSKITPLKLFMPLVFVPSTSENKDASLACTQSGLWEIVYFFSSRALQCSLEALIVLKRLILLFLAHLGTLMKPRSTWRNSGRKYSNVQSVPLAHISEALPHSNRWTYVSQLSQS